MASLQPQESVPGQPPSAQEIQRKLSMAQRKGKGRVPIPQGSGTDTEDESSVLAPNTNDAGAAHPTSQPLSAIAEHALSGPDESDEEEDVAGGWRPARSIGNAPASNDKNMTVLHSGYLWKKGSGPRKTWKKRWFVLRPTHLACYKTSAEYKLLRLLDLVEMHTVTPVQLKRHPNTCGIVTQARTFYFQAQSSTEIEEWVTKLNEAREALRRSTLPLPAPVVIVPPPTEPVPIPNSTEVPPTDAKSKSPPKVSVVVPGVSSPSVTFTEPVSPISTSRRNAPTSNTSSDSEDDVSPSARHASSSKDVKDLRDLGKPIISGYLMKAGDLRKNWRKRWFILMPTKLVYMSSHMDAKPHRQIPLSQIIDAFEYKTTTHGHKHAPPGNEQSSASNDHANNAALSSTSRVANPSSGTQSSEYGMNYIFKVVTPKKTLALSAPSEEEEVKWISAIRALIARRAKEKEGEASATTGGHAKEPSKEKEEVGTSKGAAATTSQSGATDERKRHGPNKNGPSSLNNAALATTTTTSATVGGSAPVRGGPPP